MLPLITIDLSKNFNICEDMKNKIYTEFYREFNRVLGVKKEDYKRLYVYAEELKKKVIVIESEYAYNNIVNTAKNITDIRDMVYNKEDNIVVFFFGKFVEYKYIKSIINNWSNRTSANFIIVEGKPMYHYSSNYGRFKDVVDEETLKLKKVMWELGLYAKH